MGRSKGNNCEDREVLKIFLLRRIR